MQFRTLVELPEYNFRINHKNKFILIGSCFANNIGEILVKYKFPCIYNPTGIIYNPLSIAKSIEIALNKPSITKNELFFYNELWSHYNFHSSFSSPNYKKCLERINFAIEQANFYLRTSDYLFISFGTAYYYILKEANSIVSNCHKQNPNIFERKLLTVEEITMRFKDIINKIIEKNPNLKIIFTISPIRHWKDGAINNQISKSVLFLSVKSIIESLPFNTTYYFPAYEIVHDELRDYRFYAEDMLHPSATTINYIWIKFNEAFFDKTTRDINKKIEKIIKASEHKVFNKDNQKYKEFCKKNIELIDEIESKYPELDLAKEKQFFQ